MKRSRHPLCSAFRDPITRPARPLSTLRDHGHPCTSLRSRKNSLPAWRSPFVAGGIFTPGRTSKFRLLHAFLSDQACPGALHVAVNEEPVNVIPSTSTSTSTLVAFDFHVGSASLIEVSFAKWTKRAVISVLPYPVPGHGAAAVSASSDVPRELAPRGPRAGGAGTLCRAADLGDRV